MYDELKLKKSLKCLVHYGVLLVAFYLIFIISGNISIQRHAAIFAAIVIFTALYFTVYAIVHFVRRAIDKADDKLDKHSANKIIKASKKKEYKSIYGDGE